MKKKQVSSIQELQENILSVPLVFEVALRERETIITQEKAALYTTAAVYFNKVMESPEINDEKLKSTRNILIELVQKDQTLFGSKLNTPMGDYKLLLITEAQKKLTPAVMIALAAAYDPDEKAAALVYQKITKARLGSGLKWNSSGENLAQIAAHENLPRLIQFLWKNKIFSHKEFFQPAKVCPSAIAASHEHEDLINYFEKINLTKSSDSRFSQKISFSFDSQLNQSLLSDQYEMSSIDVSRSLNS